MQITEEQWYRIHPCLTRQAGLSIEDDRRSLEAILHVLLTGIRWEELPSEYGGHAVAWRRLRVWCLDGSMAKAWRFLLFKSDGNVGLELLP